MGVPGLIAPSRVIPWTLRPCPKWLQNKLNYDVACICIHKHRPNCRFAIRHLGQVTTHVITLEAGQSSQGIFEPITPAVARRRIKTTTKINRLIEDPWTAVEVYLPEFRNIACYFYILSCINVTYWQQTSYVYAFWRIHEFWGRLHKTFLRLDAGASESQGGRRRKLGCIKMVQVLRRRKS